MGKLHQALIEDPPLYSVTLCRGLKQNSISPCRLIYEDFDWATISRAEVEIQVHCPAMNPFACSEWDRIGRIELCRDLECTQKDEIARWITPYWRRGTRRWFLDVSPFLALLSQPNVQLQQPVPEAGSPGDSSAGVAGMPDDGGSGESGNPGVQNQGGQGGAGGEAPTAWRVWTLVGSRELIVKDLKPERGVQALVAHPGWNRQSSQTLGDTCD